MKYKGSSAHTKRCNAEMRLAQVTVDFAAMADSQQMNRGFADIKGVNDPVVTHAADNGCCP
jgi:hypothetical protein